MTLEEEQNLFQIAQDSSNPDQLIAQKILYCRKMHYDCDKKYHREQTKMINSFKKEGKRRWTEEDLKAVQKQVADTLCEHYKKAILVLKDRMRTQANNAKCRRTELDALINHLARKDLYTIDELKELRKIAENDSNEYHKNAEDFLKIHKQCFGYDDQPDIFDLQLIEQLVLQSELQLTHQLLQQPLTEQFMQSIQLLQQVGDGNDDPQTIQ